MIWLCLFTDFQSIWDRWWNHQKSLFYRSSPNTPPRPPKTRPFLASFFVTVLAQLQCQKVLSWNTFWRPKSGQDRPKTRLETTFVRKRRCSRNITFSNTKCPKWDPRWSQDRPKIDPRRPQDRNQARPF